MGRKQVIDKDRVKEFLEENKTDQKIAEEMNCSVSAIKNIRRNVFGIKKKVIPKEWKNLSWIKYKDKPMAASISIRMSDLREIGVPANDNILYKVELAGDKFIIWFKEGRKDKDWESVRYGV